MSTLMRRMRAVVAGAMLGGLVACDTTEPRNAPGALPTRKSNVTPRLNASVYVAHGQLLERQGNFERAAAQYREALELNPDLLVACNRLGITLNKLGQHRAATAEFRQALTRYPDRAHLYNNLGFSLYLETRYEDAERALRRALELQPSFRRARMNHGLVLAKLGRYDEALEAFCLAGTEADAYYNLAVVQAEAGHYLDAVHALDQAIRLEPDFAAAREHLRQIAPLAVAQEAELKAAAARAEAEAAAAELAAAKEEAAATEAAATDAGRQPTEVTAAADVQPVVEVEEAEVDDALQAYPAVAEARAAQAAEIARFVAELDALIAAALEPVRPAVSSAMEAVRTTRLAELFDELIEAMVIDAPWMEDCRCRLEEFMALLDESPGQPL